MKYRNLKLYFILSLFGQLSKLSELWNLDLDLDLEGHLWMRIDLSQEGSK